MTSPAHPTLTLCMIVRDEGPRLAACLASVRGLADEIVVVDTGSRDDTAALARRLGARVVDFPWCDDFSAARNAGLAAATGRWILVLDADESVPPAAHEPLRALVSGPTGRAYNLVQRSTLPGGSATVAVHIARLFPRHPAVRFERPIHEQVNTSLERAGIQIIDTDIEFDHSGYADPAAMSGKRERNRAIIAAALAHDPEGDPNLRYFHANSYFDAGDHAAAATEYLRCATQCGDRWRKLATAARLKAAECRWRLADAAGAAALLPEGPAPDVHPLASSLRAEIAIASGRAGEAKIWLHALLSAPDSVHLPPVALAPMKFKALQDLASLWAATGRKDVAVRVLRLALEVSQGRRPAADPGLGSACASIARPA